MEFFVVIGKTAYRYAKKSAAEAFAKSKGAKVTKTAPEGVTVKKGPSAPNAPGSSKSLNQPQGANTGKFQKPSPSPAVRKGTTPSKPKAPSSTSPAKPKADAKPPAPKAPSATTAVSKPKNPRLDRKAPPKKKPPLAPKGKERINPGPPKKTVRPAILRELSRDDAPTIETMPPTSGEGRGPTTRPKVGPKKKTTSTGPTTRPNNRPSSAPKTSPRPKARPAATKAPAKTMDDPLKGWSDPRRKALASSKVGQDAGDGMKWVVGSNSNALVRTRDESKVKEQLRLQGLLKK